MVSKVRGVGLHVDMTAHCSSCGVKCVSVDAQCDYDNIPTTIFTPLEYGCIGSTEEQAIAKYGEDDIEVYHNNFLPLEWTVPHRDENACYAKLICVRSLDVRLYLCVTGPAQAN